MEIRNSSTTVTFSPSFSVNNKTFSPRPNTGGPAEDDEVPKIVNYDDVTNKPSINGVTLNGDKTKQDLKLECEIETISINGEPQSISNRNVDLPGHKEMSFKDIEDLWNNIINA